MKKLKVIQKKKKKKERREQPHQKRNPPMITRSKNYIKKKWTDRTLGQMVQAKLYRQNHTKKQTHSQKENIYIYLYIF